MAYLSHPKGGENLEINPWKCQYTSMLYAIVYMSTKQT